MHWSKTCSTTPTQGYLCYRRRRDGDRGGGGRKQRALLPLRLRRSAIWCTICWTLSGVLSAVYWFLPKGLQVQWFQFRPLSFIVSKFDIYSRLRSQSCRVVASFRLFWGLVPLCLLLRGNFSAHTHSNRSVFHAIAVHSVDTRIQTCIREPLTGLNRKPAFTLS